MAGPEIIHGGMDERNAYAWAKKSAAQGDPKGLYCLGLCYEQGKGVEADPARAADNYEAAARMDYAPAQWNLAVCFFNGIGRQKNEVEGLTWAYRSAGQDYGPAVSSLEQRGLSVWTLLREFGEGPAAGEHSVNLTSTQYEGRADRCEALRAGDRVQIRATGPKGAEKLEAFFQGGSIGLISKRSANALIALLKLDRISLEASVLECTPKSRRGKRARSAHVLLKLDLRERQTETPEQRAARIRQERAEEVARRDEEARKRAEEEKRRAEEEARRRAEEERHRAEESRKQAEREEALQIEEQWKRDCGQWEADCAKIRAEREREAGRIRDTRRSALLREAEAVRDRAVSGLDRGIELAYIKRAKAEAALARLSFLQLAERRAQKEIVARINAETLPELERRKEAAEELCRKEAEDIDEVLKRQAAEIETGVTVRFPLPPYPKKPDAVIRLEKERAAEAENRPPYHRAADALSFL